MREHLAGIVIRGSVLRFIHELYGIILATLLHGLGCREETVEHTATQIHFYFTTIIAIHHSGMTEVQRLWQGVIDDQYTLLSLQLCTLSRISLIHREIPLFLRKGSRSKQQTK